MDPSLINTKTRRNSIVKEAPRALLEADARVRPLKLRNAPVTPAKLSRKRHATVTQAHLRGAGWTPAPAPVGRPSLEVSDND